MKTKRKNRYQETPESIWNKIKLSDGVDISSLTDELNILITQDMKSSKYSDMYNYVIQSTKENKSARILDYGCGGGALLTYLRLLGYKNITGIDINSQRINNLNLIHRKMGFNQEIFHSYDGEKLPYDNSSFDLVLSQQVLEHVQNDEKYFSEAKRILAPEGKFLLDFPHRLVPFDTHTRMWFVHYFPSTVRNFFYNRYRENRGEYYNSLLNLKSVWYYKRLLKNMFSSTLDVSKERVGSFTYKDQYEGNILIRSMIDKLINLPFVGKIFKKIVLIFSGSTLIVSR